MVRDIYEYHATAAVVPAIRGERWHRGYPPSVADELPNVVSQDFLFVMLDLEIKRALRYARPLSVVLISAALLRLSPDKRSFEKTGQLYEFAKQLERIRRNTDIVGRLATGELLFVLTETSLDNTSPMTKRVRAALEPLVGSELRAGTAGLSHSDPKSPGELVAQATANLETAG
jgi:PleD family two-component response regulator